MTVFAVEGPTGQALPLGSSVSIEGPEITG
jgi:hypothetical protein